MNAAVFTNVNFTCPGGRQTGDVPISSELLRDNDPFSASTMAISSVPSGPSGTPQGAAVTDLVVQAGTQDQPPARAVRAGTVVAIQDAPG